APPAARSAQLSMFGKPVEATASEKQTFESDRVKYYLVETAELRRELAEKLSQQRIISIESISDDAPNFNQELRGLAFSWQKDEAHFVPAENSDAAKRIAEDLKPVIENEGIAKVGHNLKASMLLLKKHGVELRGDLFDVMLAHYLIEPEASHSLEVLCSQYLDYELLADPDSKQKNQVCERADKVLQMKEGIENDLASRQHTKLMREVEMPLATVLASMEFEGVKV